MASNYHRFPPRRNGYYAQAIRARRTFPKLSRPTGTPRAACKKIRPEI
jgi:hypothetical protein